MKKTGIFAAMFFALLILGCGTAGTETGTTGEDIAEAGTTAEAGAAASESVETRNEAAQETGVHKELGTVPVSPEAQPYIQAIEDMTEYKNIQDWDAFLDVCSESAKSSYEYLLEEESRENNVGLWNVKSAQLLFAYEVGLDCLAPNLLREGDMENPDNKAFFVGVYYTVHEEQAGIHGGLNLRITFLVKEDGKIRMRENQGVIPENIEYIMRKYPVDSDRWREDMAIAMGTAEIDLSDRLNGKYE